MVVEEATQIIVSNWKVSLLIGAYGAAMFMLGAIVMFMLYVIYKVFPHIDAYVNIVKSYWNFMFEEKRKHLTKYDYFHERQQSRILMWVFFTIMACLIALLILK